MNVGNHRAELSMAGHLSSPVLEQTYRALSWLEIVNIRTLNPKCNSAKEALALAAAHPDSVFGREVETYIGKTTIGTPARNAEQAIALRRLAVLEDHEVTIDALRDTGLPEALAVDLVKRLLPRPIGCTLFERMAATPNLNAWARAVLTRDAPVHVADDILTLRILQTFGHDVAVPWSLDTTNRWVYFYSAASQDPEGIGQLLDIATHDRPVCLETREVCRKAYQALAYCHHGADGQIWPHWEIRREAWEIRPDPREGYVDDDVVSSNGITCDTERWLRNVTLLGGLNAPGYHPRTAPYFDSDLSDPENVECDPQRARIAPRDLHERFELMAANRRNARRAALEAALPPQPPHSDASMASPGTDR
ncbi:hypothetical protein PAN31117_04013 [Pandoraea anapnoica]|uniref:Uncharacterized protein n=1 Tax=Pandoraea anapnoica TaxID=2508301 RepID=A0A5E5AE05_9BURK|nr:hypothetical protein [Pandoraea anapnoica]VVE71336.1 hypothetical protein PAN31117_04013 [Pandoraea anapnoica]